jgi:hypothetical protein
LIGLLTSHRVPSEWNRPTSAQAVPRRQKLIAEWTVASLQQSIGWAQKPITIDYAGRMFLLLPEDEQNLPTIATLGEHAVCKSNFCFGPKAVIASVTGTETDPQGYSRQV